MFGSFGEWIVFCFHSAASMLCLDKRQSALEVNLLFKAISQSVAEVRTRIEVAAHPSVPVMWNQVPSDEEIQTRVQSIARNLITSE